MRIVEEVEGPFTSDKVGVACNVCSFLMFCSLSSLGRSDEEVYYVHKKCARKVKKGLSVRRDARGFLYELWRSDQVPDVAQAMLSYSIVGTIRAWHRHARGQDDYLVVTAGRARIVWVDEKARKFHVEEVNGTLPRLVFVPGASWHGTQALTNTTTVYFVTRLYDEGNPDELRLPLDSDFGWGKFAWES